jgi:hypothetical protein
MHRKHGADGLILLPGGCAIIRHPLTEFEISPFATEQNVTAGQDRYGVCLFMINCVKRCVHISEVKDLRVPTLERRIETAALHK